MPRTRTQSWRPYAQGWSEEFPDEQMPLNPFATAMRYWGRQAAKAMGVYQGIPFGESRVAEALRGMKSDITGQPVPPRLPQPTWQEQAGAMARGGTPAAREQAKQFIAEKSGVAPSIPIPPVRGRGPGQGVFVSGQPWKAPQYSLTPAWQDPSMGQAIVTLPSGQQLTGQAVLDYRKALQTEEANRALAAGPETIGAGPTYGERIRQNAVRYGLELPREGDTSELVQYLTAKYNRARNTSERAVLGEQLAAAQGELKAQQQQGRAMAQQKLGVVGAIGVAHEQAQGVLGAARFKALQDEARTVAQTQGRSKQAIAKILSSAINSDQLDARDPAQLAAAMETIEAAFGPEGGEQGGQAQANDAERMRQWDVDQSGDLNAEEKEKAIKFMRTTLNRYEAMTPEQQAKWKNHTSVLDALAIRRQLEKRSAKKAEAVFAG